MLEFSKFILVRMSFNENLFFKELRKLIIWSNNEGTEELKEWCINNFSDKYNKDKLMDVFKS